MSIAERFKHLSVLKRKMAWYATQAEADLESGLQPEASVEHLPDDIKMFLTEHNLRHSHPLQHSWWLPLFSGNYSVFVVNYVLIIYSFDYAIFEHGGEGGGHQKITLDYRGEVKWVQKRIT